jgi:hypothetical protein
VIPELKLTDRGLVDVRTFRLVPLFLGDAEKNVHFSHLEMKARELLEFDL